MKIGKSGNREIAKPAGRPLISFLVPLFNGLGHTRALLDSLLATVPADLAWELLFVDDGSTDGTRAWLATVTDPRIRVLLNERNLGFAGANNRAAAAATGEFLALLNNDLVLLPGWLEPMLKVLRNPSLAAGLVGNVQVRVDDGSVDHAGITADVHGKLTHLRSLPERAAGALPVFAVTAACCLLARADFNSVGGFDEGFVNGGEDVDLALKLRRKDRRSYVALASVVRHHVSASRGPVSLRDEQNSMRLYQRWRAEIHHEIARSWAREMAKPGSACLDRLSAWAHVSGLPVPPPRKARLLAASALWREEARWRSMNPGAGGADPGPAPASAYRCTGFMEGSPAWLKQRASFTLPAGLPTRNAFLCGKVTPEDPTLPTSLGPVGVRLTVNGLQRIEYFPLPTGDFNLAINEPACLPDTETRIDVEILGPRWSHLLGITGRLLSQLPLTAALRARCSEWRLRRRNRRLQFTGLVCDDAPVFDLRTQLQLFPALRLRGGRAGLNIVGWLRAELGLGESARCMVRACDASGLPAALVDMRLPCLNRAGDESFAARLQDTNPHPVNVFHIDPPVAAEIDQHHGRAFRFGKYNIAYWAWEQPQFPDAWVPQAAYYDEIWCPSDFVRRAVAEKIQLPVRVMPHAITVPRSAGDARPRFGLPAGRFLFLFLYDLNSYQERKNPQAVIEAYRRAFPDEQGVGLVIKTHNRERNAEAFARLQASLAGLSQAQLVSATLPRAEVHALEAACDCFVSLHRSEGFGLGVAECMALGKPVISTDWSATAEFVTEENGCPVKASVITLDRDHGPYRKGGTWADPDIDHAAWHMRRLAADPALALRLGATAKADMAARFSPEVVGTRYRRRLSELGLA
jgi:GT2 family glycosyltransferase/glycosyltransferase involved in cell wall biosynthesis